MDFVSLLQNVNYLAVLVATIAAFVIGAVWYSPMLFGNAWMKELGIKPGKEKKGMGALMAKSFLVTFIMATTLAVFSPVVWDVVLSTCAILGFGIGAMTGINNMIYEMKSSQLMLINAGYVLMMFLAMGAIIGAWQ